MRTTLNASSLAHRVLMTGRVLQAQRLFPEATTAQKIVDLTRVTTSRGEADADEDGRGASVPQQNVRMPIWVCGENIERHDRFGLSGSAVHPRCALHNAVAASDAGEDWFGTEVIGEAGRPRRGAVPLVDFQPRLHMRMDQQLRIGRLWEDVASGAGDEGGERDRGW